MSCGTRGVGSAGRLRFAMRGDHPEANLQPLWTCKSRLQHVPKITGIRSGAGAGLTSVDGMHPRFSPKKIKQLCSFCNGWPHFVQPWATAVLKSLKHGPWRIV
eukprot:s4796_g2.t1